MIVSYFMKILNNITLSWHYSRHIINNYIRFGNSFCVTCKAFKICSRYSNTKKCISLKIINTNVKIFKKLFAIYFYLKCIYNIYNKKKLSKLLLHYVRVDLYYLRPHVLCKSSLILFCVWFKTFIIYPFFPHLSDTYKKITLSFITD